MVVILIEMFTAYDFNLPGAVILQEAAQGVASMRTEEPQRLTKERPPKASLGSLGIQEQRQEVAQHQGQEQSKQDHQSSQHKLSSHHLTYSLTPGTTTPCSSYLNLISQQEAYGALQQLSLSLLSSLSLSAYLSILPSFYLTLSLACAQHSASLPLPPSIFLWNGR